jgi:hypothetical protein
MCSALLLHTVAALANSSTCRSAIASCTGDIDSTTCGLGCVNLSDTSRGLAGSALSIALAATELVENEFLLLRFTGVFNDADDRCLGVLTPA